MDFFEAIDKRYSHRFEFLDTPVPMEDLIKIAEAGTKAPSAGNLQTQRFVIITDPQTRAKIAEIYNGHPGMSTAPAFIALVSKHQELGPNKISFELKDYGAAAENVLLAAAALGYASLWTDGDTSVMVPERERKMAALLGVPEGRTVRAVLPVGIPKTPGRQPARKPLEQLVKFEKYL